MRIMKDQPLIPPACSCNNALSLTNNDYTYSHAVTCPCYRLCKPIMSIPGQQGEKGTPFHSLMENNDLDLLPPPLLRDLEGSGPPSVSSLSIGGGGSEYSFNPPRPSSMATSLNSVSLLLDKVMECTSPSLASLPSGSSAVSGSGRYSRVLARRKGRHGRSPSMASVSSMASHIQSLPTEVFLNIFGRLDLADLKEASLINHEWHSMAMPVLWRRLVIHMDKRRLAAMRPILATYGRYVCELVVSPPESITANVYPAAAPAHSGRSLSRRTSTTSSVGRSQSLSQQPQPPLTQSRSNSTSTTPRLGSLGSLNLPPYHGNTALASTAADVHHRVRHSTPSPSPTMSPLRLTPIPGTPGVGNMPIDTQILPFVAPTSESGAGDGGLPATQAVVANALPTAADGVPPHHGGATTNNGNNNNSSSGSNNGGNNSNSNNSGGWGAGHLSSPSIRQVEVTESTISRMQRYIEQYCPNVSTLTVQNPLGIGCPERRYLLLEMLFDTYPNLERLSLRHFIMWDPNPLQMVPTKLRRLRELDMSGRVEVSDSDVSPIVRGCPNLSTLKLRATNIDDSTLDTITTHLAAVLKYLDISGCRITSAALGRLVSRCHALRVLRGWSCLPLNDNFLLSLRPENLPNLRVLDLKSVYSFSSEAAQRTFGWQDWPQLCFLRVHYKGEPVELSGVRPAAQFEVHPCANSAGGSSVSNAPTPQPSSHYSSATRPASLSLQQQQQANGTIDNSLTDGT